MGTFRLYPDPQEWAALIERALAGDPEAQREVRVLGPERERQIEDAVSRGGSGSLLQLGTVGSYDTSDRKATVWVTGSSHPGLRNFTGFALKSGDEVVVDLALRVVVALRASTGWLPAPHEASALFVDYPLSGDPAGGTHATSFGGQWCVDHDGRYGTDVVVVPYLTSSSTPNATSSVTVYDIGTNSYTDLLDGAISIDGLRWFGGYVFRINGNNVQRLEDDLTWTTVHTREGSTNIPMVCTGGTLFGFDKEPVTNTPMSLWRLDDPLGTAEVITGPTAPNVTANYVLSGNDDHMWISSFALSGARARAWVSANSDTPSWTQHINVSPAGVYQRLGSPETVAVTPNGSLVLLDTAEVRVVDKTTGAVTVYTDLGLVLTSANTTKVVAVSDTEWWASGKAAAVNVEPDAGHPSGKTAAVIVRYTPAGSEVRWYSVTAPESTSGRYAVNLELDEVTPGVWRWSRGSVGGVYGDGTWASAVRYRGVL